MRGPVCLRIRVRSHPASPCGPPISAVGCLSKQTPAVFHLLCPHLEKQMCQIGKCSDSVFIKNRGPPCSDGYFPLVKYRASAGNGVFNYLFITRNIVSVIVRK